MKHNWIQLDCNIPERWFKTLRQCTHCGKVHERHTEHVWMRVTGYKWLPLIGRCKGAWEPNEEAKQFKVENNRY